MEVIHLFMCLVYRQLNKKKGKKAKLEINFNYSFYRT